MAENSYRDRIRNARQIVIKIGSQVLIDAQAKPEPGVFEQLAENIAHLVHQGRKVAIVSSGAIVSGISHLSGLSKNNLSLAEKQAIAGVGQPILMQFYQKAFEPYKLLVGQVLLTHEDFSIRHRYLHSKNTLEQMQKLGIIPIINENDTVAVDEIRFGENDQLAALVAVMLKADLLVMLSVAKGICERDPLKYPDAQVIPVIKGFDQKLYECGEESKSRAGSGGIKSKLYAVEIASSAGIPTFIGSGKDPEVLRKLFEGKLLGSLVIAEKRKLKGLKHWLYFAGRAKGEIIVDTGAVKALVELNKSLLPKGVVEIRGKFNPGELVRVMDEQGREVGKGLVNYSAEQLKKIKGKHTNQIKELLGTKDYDEVIHRDNLALAFENKN